MDYARLGNAGLVVSRLGLGMMSYGDPAWRSWVLPEDEARPFVRRAVEAGINFFDTADMYSRGVSEEVTGRLLKEFTHRDDVVIGSKVFFPLVDGPNRRGLSRKHIFASVTDSLRRLDVDYIDLYQIHRWDHDTPIEETMEALHDVVKAGYVRYLGASSMFAWQFARALHQADLRGTSRFVSMQNHYPETDHILDAVGEVAEARGVSRAQVALAWLLSRPGVVAPIVGATKMAHLDDAVAAVSLELDQEEVARLEASYVPRPVLGHR